MAYSVSQQPQHGESMQRVREVLGERSGVQSVQRTIHVRPTR